MKTKVNIGLLQFAPVLGNIALNIRKINHLLEKTSGIDLWVLPELASSGYNFSSKEEALRYSEPLNDSLFTKFLIKKAKALNTLFVSGINEREGDKIFNSAVLIGPNGITGHYRKLHLFNREKEFFEPGNTGLPVFNTPIGKIGILICFDWMFPESWRLLALKGATLICHPSNLVLPYCQTALPGYALTNQIFVASANRVGKDNDLSFTGQSVLVNPNGEYLLKGSPHNEEILSYGIDLSEASNKQMTPFNQAFADRRTDIYSLHEKDFNPMVQMEKRRLRIEVKQTIQELSFDERLSMSQNIMTQLEKHSYFQKANTIFIYWSLPDEVQTHDFIKRWMGKKKFILPKINGDQLELREFTGISDLKPDEKFHISEPTGRLVNDPSLIDLAIVPGIAFTSGGARLGRGKGYYDRTLPLLNRAFKVGVAFPAQIVKDIPTDGNDVFLDQVITV
ncbi:5-formyltetrahydrofolate cyclo-ligase [Thermophagus sp. OGC60D27]|uniref:5-formyltetrahydrofolate cyclo-ligase n=1 Tax=Thermophagus sp. OGC60D27 TaxID=3458415 RepID=UPI0040378DA9